MAVNDTDHSNVYGLPATTTFSVEQALASAGQLELSSVLVIGHDKDGDLLIRSSRMSREGALWLVEKARAYVLSET
jgi:hypothetical protein